MRPTGAYVHLLESVIVVFSGKGTKINGVGVSKLNFPIFSAEIQSEILCVCVCMLYTCACVCARVLVCECVCGHVCFVCMYMCTHMCMCE